MCFYPCMPALASKEKVICFQRKALLPLPPSQPTVPKHTLSQSSFCCLSAASPCSLCQLSHLSRTLFSLLYGPRLFAVAQTVLLLAVYCSLCTFSLVCRPMNRARARERECVCPETVLSNIDSEREGDLLSLARVLLVISPFSITVPIEGGLITLEN